MYIYEVYKYSECMHVCRCMHVKIISCFAILFHIAGRKPIDEQVAEKNINCLAVVTMHGMDFSAIVHEHVFI